MKIGRFERDGEELVGVVRGDHVVDVDSFDEALRRVTDGGDLDASGDAVALDDVSYLPPTTGKNAVFAAALNYRSHVDETDMATPERPLIFLKLYRSLVGNGQPIANHTSVTSKLDYEAELAAVVGKPAHDVSSEEALDHVAG
jgi:2-keto-4-pentenoate hydratase/2-oxohepta-3-ene-1,7-dioic acid hydratase in catechol pathway